MRFTNEFIQIFIIGKIHLTTYIYSHVASTYCSVFVPQFKSNSRVMCPSDLFKELLLFSKRNFLFLIQPDNFIQNFETFRKNSQASNLVRNFCLSIMFINHCDNKRVEKHGEQMARQFLHIPFRFDFIL